MALCRVSNTRANGAGILDCYPHTVLVFAFAKSSLAITCLDFGLLNPYCKSRAIVKTGIVLLSKWPAPPTTLCLTFRMTRRGLLLA